MRRILGLLLLAASVLGQEPEVKDKDRACPDGYFYGGEVPAHLPTGQMWEKGPRSPVYSCYLIERGPFDWVNATKKCSKQEGQLLSVNNYQEVKVLTGELFLREAFGAEGDWESNFPTDSFATSGISLAQGHWTWFGAGEHEPGKVNQSIVDEIRSDLANSSLTYCIEATFFHRTDFNGSSSVSIEYSARPCLDQFTAAVCEVRVYEQVWYVWFTTNWLQILFLLTLVMLLVSTCITFQIWVSRGRGRRGAHGARPSNSPPAYSVTDGQAQDPRGRFVSAADRYTEKGKELMAKVVFYRKPEDKQRLATEA